MSTQRAARSCGRLAALLLLLAGCSGEGPPPDAGPVYRSVPGLEIEPSSLAYEERRGALLFEKYCALCHGNQGQGDGFNAFNLDPRPTNLADPARQRQLTPDHLREVIREGGRGVNLAATMPAYGATLTQEQIEDLVSYIPLLGREVPKPDEGTGSSETPIRRP